MNRCTHSSPLAMAKFTLFLLTLDLIAAASTDGGAAAADDDVLAQRRKYMAQLVRLGHLKSPAVVDAETFHRLKLFLKREIGPIQAIFHAIRRMPENSAADVRAKDEAFDATMELLDRRFLELLPFCRDDDDVGFAIGNMPENTAEEVRAKEDARAAAKKMVYSKLVKIDDDV